MSQEGFSLSATLKGGTGYDAPWVVVYANDPGELKAKLAGIAEQGVLQATVDAANQLKGVNNAAPLTNTDTPAPAPQAQAAPQQQPWGQRAPAQQQAPQGGGGRFGNETPHPEGKQCGECGQVLVLKKTQSGKSKWQCTQWRWNNGNPNGHGMEWVK